MLPVVPFDCLYISSASCCQCLYYLFCPLVVNRKRSAVYVSHQIENESKRCLTTNQIRIQLKTSRGSPYKGSDAMIDHTQEHLLSFSQAAKRLPKRGDGRNVHPNTVARWTREGIRGIRLETIRVGTRCFTSVEACQRFFADLTTAAQPPRSGVCTEGTTGGNAAMQALSKAGI